jgi:hypothetical protein
MLATKGLEGFLPAIFEDKKLHLNKKINLSKAASAFSYQKINKLFGARKYYGRLYCALR